MRNAPKRDVRAILASIVGLVMIALLPGSARAAAGDLDPRFGGDGRVTTNLTPGDDIANDVAIQGDGKIVVAGVADGKFALVRYNPEGTLDRTFGRAGTVRTVVGQARGSAGVSAIAIQSNGKIVAVGGTSYWRTGTRLAMVRYRPNGTLDPTFSGNGKVIATFMGGASDLAIQTDGKIVAAGASGTSFVVARYQRDGSLDPTFGTGGKVMTSVSDLSADDAAVAIQADGKVIVAGDESFFVLGAGWEDAVVVRYQTDGSLDPTFGTAGMVHVQLTRQFREGGIAIQTDGKIVLAGMAGFCCEWTGSFGLIRLDAAGTLDSTFGGDGKLTTNFTGRNGTAPEDRASDVAIQSNGKIVAVGVAGAYGPGIARFAVARYSVDGTLDRSFSGNGKLTTGFRGPTFNPDMPWVGSWANGVAIQSNGKIIAVGSQRWELADRSGTAFRFALARYLAR
jgi:uncharacterized delta-60 repeat protein